jgi:hypothetical protein
MQLYPGLVHLKIISNGWSVAFFSEAGNLPLIQATSERLSGDAKVVVTEMTKGDLASLIMMGLKLWANKRSRHWI